MTITIIIFACFILLAGVVLLWKPEILFKYLSGNNENSMVQAGAVVIRLIIGALLVAQSGVSRFPVVIEILGWVFIVSGVALLAIGRNNFRKLLAWVIEKFAPFGRFAGVVAMAFGGFLLYSFFKY